MVLDEQEEMMSHPPISEEDINKGMMDLLNRGIIPKDVDLTPAFERGKAPFEYGQAKIEIKELEKPPQWKHKIVPGPIKYVKRGGSERKRDYAYSNIDMPPDTNLHRDGAFITQMDVQDNPILQTQQNQK